MPHLDTKQLLLTYRDVTVLAHVCESTVKRWVASGELPYVKMGKPKPNRVRDNRPIRFRIKDVATLAGVTPEEIRAALAVAEGGENK